MFFILEGNLPQLPQKKIDAARRLRFAYYITKITVLILHNYD